MMSTSKLIEDRLAKLEFQVRLLAESLNPAESPIASLVIGFNWSEQELDAAHDIFEKFDGFLASEERINWHEFESDFKSRLRMSYQAVKSVVLAFYANGQWEDVCRSYALSFGDSVPIELKKITRPPDDRYDVPAFLRRQAD
jgi:hypothetical protein